MSGVFLVVLLSGRGNAAFHEVTFEAPIGEAFCTVTAPWGDIDGAEPERGGVVSIDFSRKGEESPEKSDFEVKQTVFPHINICWSSNGQYCAVLFYHRDSFTLHIADVRGERFRRSEIDLKTAVGPLGAEEGELRGKLKDVRWLTDDTVQVDFEMRSDDQPVKVRCTVSPQGGGWKVRNLPIKGTGKDE